MRKVGHEIRVQLPVQFSREVERPPKARILLQQFVWENAVFVEHYFPGSYEEMRCGEIYDLVEIDFIAGGFPQTKWRRLQSETTREIPRFKGVAENG